MSIESNYQQSNLFVNGNLVTATPANQHFNEQLREKMKNIKKQQIPLIAPPILKPLTATSTISPTKINHAAMAMPVAEPKLNSTSVSVTPSNLAHERVVVVVTQPRGWFFGRVVALQHAFETLGSIIYHLIFAPSPEVTSATRIQQMIGQLKRCSDKMKKDQISQPPPQQGTEQETIFNAAKKIFCEAKKEMRDFNRLYPNSQFSEPLKKNLNQFERELCISEKLISFEKALLVYPAEDPTWDEFNKIQTTYQELTTLVESDSTLTHEKNFKDEKTFTEQLRKAYPVFDNFLTRLINLKIKIENEKIKSLKNHANSLESSLKSINELKKQITDIQQDLTSRTLKGKIYSLFDYQDKISEKQKLIKNQIKKTLEVLRNEKFDSHEIEWLRSLGTHRSSVDKIDKIKCNIDWLNKTKEIHGMTNALIKAMYLYSLNESFESLKIDQRLQIKEGMIRLFAHVFGEGYENPLQKNLKTTHRLFDELFKNSVSASNALTTKFKELNEAIDLLYPELNKKKRGDLIEQFNLLIKNCLNPKMTPAEMTPVEMTPKTHLNEQDVILRNGPAENWRIVIC